MIDKEDPKEFDLDALYKSGAKEMPSAKLDEQIKSLAKDHVSEDKALSEERKLLSNPWYRGLSTAAVLVVCVHLFLEVRDQQSEAELSPMEFSDEMKLERKVTPSIAGDEIREEAQLDVLDTEAQETQAAPMAESMAKSRAKQAPSPLRAPAPQSYPGTSSTMENSAIQAPKERVIELESSADDFSLSGDSLSEVLPERREKEHAPSLKLKAEKKLKPRLQEPQSKTATQGFMADPRDAAIEERTGDDRLHEFDLLVQGLEALVKEEKWDEANEGLIRIEIDYPDFTVPKELVEIIRVNAKEP